MDVCSGKEEGRFTEEDEGKTNISLLPIERKMIGSL
jgi:hypothetical protein